MSEKQEDNVVQFSKSQLRRKAIMDGKPFDAYTNEILDEDFEVFMQAFFGPYTGPGYNPE